MAVTAARDDPRNVQLGLLIQSLNDTIDIAAKQSAALSSHTLYFDVSTTRSSRCG